MSARKKRIAALAGYFQIALAVIGFVEVIRRFVGVEEMRDFSTMIIVSTLALIANGFCLYLLQKSKSKEAHMQASAIFTSNDVIINLGVITAGVLVYLLGSNKLDLVNRNNSICRGRSGSDEDFETRKMMIGYILVIYLVFYFGAAFVLPSYRVWKRTGVNPVTFRGADTARDYIGKLFKIVMLALALAVVIYAFAPNFYPYLLPIAWLENRTILYCSPLRETNFRASILIIWENTFYGKRQNLDFRREGENRRSGFERSPRG